MRLTKKEAFDIFKVLFHYDVTREYGTCVSDPVANVKPLLNCVERFLCSDDKEFLCVAVNDGKDESDEEAEDRDYDPEETPGEEDEDEFDEQACSGCSQSEDCDCYSKGEDEDRLEYDDSISGSWLPTRLGELRARVVSSAVGSLEDKVKLSFEHTAKHGTSLVVESPDSSTSFIDRVTYVKRLGKELHVAAHDTGERVWHVFSVAKYTPDWTEFLDLGTLYEVV